MSLSVLTPFKYENFCKVNSSFIEKLILHHKKDEPDFWYSLLKKYSFNKMDFKEGEAKRLEFHRLLKDPKGNLVKIFDEIMDWGNMKKLNEEMGCNLKNSLDILDGLSTDNITDFEVIKGICITRIASITKIYEMWDPDNWIIYDSYCVKGLQWFVSKFWQFPQHKINKKYLLLPWPPGRTGRPIEGFPRTGDTAPRQKRLGFIYGSWLCKYMAAVLNRIDSNNMQWRTFHVEMLAFQKGHEI